MSHMGDGALYLWIVGGPKMAFDKNERVEK